MSLPMLDPIPQYEAVIDRESGRFAGVWYRWLTQVVGRLLTVPLQSGTAVHRMDLNLPIVPTTLFMPTRDGDYVVSWTAQILVPATGSSSLAVTIGWVSQGAACSKTFAALTGNTTGTADGGSVAIRPDSGTAVTYSTSYASVGATPMEYLLDVWPVQEA